MLIILQNKLKRKCMEEAISQCKPARTDLKGDNTSKLDNPFEPPCIDWYSGSTFSVFGSDLDIIPTGEFGDTELAAEDCDSQDLSSSEDEEDDNAKEEEEEVELEKQLDEKDQLDDHLYEERLWMLFKSRDKRDDAEADEEEDEEDRRERMNLEENDEEEEAEEDEDRRRSEVETTDIGEGTEDGLITNDDDDDGPSDEDEQRDEREESDAELTRMQERAAEKSATGQERTKQTQKHKIGNSNTGSSAKQIFKSQEFISTSDEEEL